MCHVLQQENWSTPIPNQTRAGCPYCTCILFALFAFCSILFALLLTFFLGCSLCYVKEAQCLSSTFPFHSSTIFLPVFYLNTPRQNTQDKKNLFVSLFFVKFFSSSFSRKFSHSIFSRPLLRFLYPSFIRFLQELL